MHKPHTIAILAALATATAFGQSWNHDPTSPNGPNSWGFLGAYNAFATCGTDKQAVGAKQTPINIDTKAVVKSDLPNLNFRYRPTELVVEHLGHVIEVMNEAEESHLLVGSSLADDYKLVQFHFHTPSEHKIDGVAADMEVHFVHQNALGELAVVGVMLKIDEARKNLAYDRIFNNAPYLFFRSTAASDPHGEINPAELLPERRSYYTYSGSLTTPPCSEGVRWFVMTQPVSVSASSVAINRKLLSQSPVNNFYPYNNRPIQPANSRPVLGPR